MSNDVVKAGEQFSTDNHPTVIDSFEGVRGSRYLPAPYNPEGEGLPVKFGAESIILPAQLKTLVERPRGGGGIIKSRPGKGGSVQYVGWTDAASLLDDVFGPGQYTLEIEHINEEMRPDPEMPSQFVTTYTVQYLFRDRANLVMPFTVFGWGDCYWKDKSAHRADALEAAYSRALTKSSARLCKWIRAVWAKDDEAMKAITSANPGQVSTAEMVIKQLKAAGKEEGISRLLSNYGVSENDLKKLTQLEITALSKDLGDLL